MNMVTILMMSEKMDTLGLLKIKLFRNKDCKVIISVYDVINKNLSCDSNLLEIWSCDLSLVTLGLP